ncbi:hypothetical protein BJ912DRAFT_921527 [Pholiota molesta]|nr:hypothetical protein BJ912DRAFT_921527 [Pholiota molesta]
MACSTMSRHRCFARAKVDHVFEQQKNYEQAKGAYERIVEIDFGYAKTVLQRLGWLHHQGCSSFQNQELGITYDEDGGRPYGLARLINFETRSRLIQEPFASSPTYQSASEFGFVPFAVFDVSSTGREGSRTLGYAFEDFGIRRVAQLLGKASYVANPIVMSGIRVSPAMDSKALHNSDIQMAPLTFKTLSIALPTIAIATQI